MDETQDIHGIEMDVYKVVSPDEIVLRRIHYNASRLLNRMKKEYSAYINKKNNQQLTWNINDLCAVYIKKYGYWYRGKIVNMDVLKQTVSVYFYDMDLKYDDVCLNTLWPLKKTFVEEICVFVHCAMDKVVPLDVSDKKWPQHICDRLIAELKKFPQVYFVEKAKSEGEEKVFGEIWIKKILKPHPLEPLQIHWINLNKFMIGQVFADDDENSKDGELSTIGSETKTFYSSYEQLKNQKLICSWLPPVPVTESPFKAVVTNVDMQCCIYLQSLDSVKLLVNITKELNSMFKDSDPEPNNYKWTKGQMVTVKYHLNNLWYRGKIINADKNEEFTVQFIDYGNVESCSREELRSALCNIDVPQLCFKGYFSSILPMTTNCKWPRSTLDFIHYLIVDKWCTVRIDFTKSSTDLYAIKQLHNEVYKDVTQYLVTNNYAHYEHINRSTIDLMNENQLENQMRNKLNLT